MCLGKCEQKIPPAHDYPNCRVSKETLWNERVMPIMLTGNYNWRQRVMIVQNQEPDRKVPDGCVLCIGTAKT
jgi:hypothetical protein